MLKVLIADDERNICLMIRKMIPWEDYGMEVAGMAHNGIDAGRLMEEERPDIIISDIRMPGCDGLDLVRKARDMKLQADFIIISGYKYFEYAHTALNLGVEYYLLKPIDRQELEDTLKKIALRREQDTEKEREEEELRRQADYSRRKVREHFLSSIMERRNRVRELDLDSVNREYQCDFTQGSFAAVFTKLDTEIMEQDLSVLLRRMEDCIDREMEGGDVEYINCAVKSGIVTIVNYPYGQTDEIRAEMEKTHARMKQELEKFRGYFVTVGIGGEKETISGVADSVDEAVRAIKCRGKAGLGKVIYYSRLHYRPVPLQTLLDEKHVRGLEKIVETLDSEAFLGEVQGAVKEISSEPMSSPASVYDYLDQVSALVLGALRGMDADAGLTAQLEEDLQKVMDFYADTGQMTYQFSALVGECFEKILEERKNRSQLPIRMAGQYIRDNFSRQISLEEVAEAIHLSPAYLSTLFKKEMGINFSDYLTSCRMEAAKELLKTTDLPIASLANQVGYADPRYFSKTFARTVGLKPSVYRKMFR